MLMQMFLPSIPVDPTGESTRLVRRGMLAMALFFGGLGVWSAVAPISGAVVAGGMIKIDSHRKTVQHLDGGIVKEILVREGNNVQTGQPLVILEDADTRADMNILEHQLKTLRVREARLKAEKSFSSKAAFPLDIVHDTDPKSAEIIATEKALFETRRRNLDEETKILKDEIAHGREAIAQIGSEIQAIRDGIAYGEKQITAVSKLLEKRFVQESEIWKLQADLAEKKERLGARLAALAQQRENVADLELRIITARNTYVAEADTELKDLNKEMADVEEKLRPARNAVNRQVITAPVSGQVIDLKVTTVGGVVRPGDDLMDIVPASRDMLMEVRVKDRDIDNVHMEQPADVQLSAFNARLVPMVKGKVVYVSGDALEDQITHEPYYLAHVKVSEEALKPVADLSLSPGMPVTAFLATKPRTFYQYLMAPIVERVRKSVREE